MGGIGRGKSQWALALWVTLAACGSAVPPVSFTAPLRAESMQCAEDRLRAADYDVGWDGDLLEGEVRIMAGEIATRREFIRVTAVSQDERINILVKSSWHPAWSVTGPPGTRLALEREPSGLMRITRPLKLRRTSGLSVKSRSTPSRSES